MKKIVNVTTEMMNGKEVVTLVRTVNATYGVKYLSAKEIERVKNFMKNAKYRENYHVESVFEICCYSGYEYRNTAI